MSNRRRRFQSDLRPRLDIAQNFFVTLAGSTLAFACATNSTISTDKVDPNAAARSQAYMQEVSYATVGSRLTDALPCAAPSDLEKTFGKGQGAGPSTGWRDLIGRANACTQQSNWAVLQTIASGMARIDSDSPWGVYFLGIAAEAKGEYSRALWMTDQAQKKAGGKSPLFSYQRGHILLKMGETVKAMEELNRSVSLDPRLNEAHLFLAEIFHRDQEFNKASVHYQAALQNEPNSYRALIGLAEVRLQAGAPEEAVALYARAQAVDSKQPRTWIRIAHIQENILKNSEQALSAYKGLRSIGELKVKLDFNLEAKIKALEETVRVARLPAEAGVGQPNQSNSGTEGVKSPVNEDSKSKSSQQRSVK